MKTKEIEAIGKKLLPLLPGFAVKGRLLFMRPLGHILRAICFDDSIDPRRFYAQVFIQPMCVPVEHFVFNFGWRLGGGCTTWDTDSIDLVKELGATLTHDALPFLSHVESPVDVLAAALKVDKSADFYVQQALAFTFARAGDVDRACDGLTGLVGLMHRKVPWQRDVADRADALKSLLVTDPAAAQLQLSRWEKATVQSLGLESAR